MIKKTEKIEKKDSNGPTAMNVHIHTNRRCCTERVAARYGGEVQECKIYQKEGEGKQDLADKVEMALA